VREFAPEQREFLLGLIDRTVDLMEAISRHHYFHHDFNGSNSIKAVLPVMVPELTYKELLIQDGATASERWLACVIGEVEQLEAADVFEGLRRYCHLDTLAMVRIWEKLSCLAQQTNSQ